MDSLVVQSRRIEYVRLQAKVPANISPAIAPVIIMLHEGLGSIAMWRDFPRQLADATGCDVVVYSRYGYGGSDPVDAGFTVEFMHDEALLSLPDLLDQLDIRRPVLLGHSDGASIALIHAGMARREVRGVIAMAPHLFVENLTVSSIAATKSAYGVGGLRTSLARYHKNVDALFRAWSDVWLHPDFLQWNIEACLPTINCPVLAIQGVDDEYGTMEQIECLGRSGADCRVLKIPECRHSPHRDQPGVVLKAVADFVGTLLRGQCNL